MKFHIDADTGDAIWGWLRPDDPSETPVIEALLPGRDPVAVAASVRIREFVDQGLHDNGVCGFRFDDRHIPGIADEPEIELRDAATGQSLHRRFRDSGHIDAKVAIFDIALLPQKKIHAHFSRLFANRHFCAEAISFENLLQIVQSAGARSVILTGRPSCALHGSNLKANGYATFALLRPPFEELAERLLFLSMAAGSKNGDALMSLARGLEPLADFVRTFPFNDARAMDRAFRQALPKHKELLRDPLTRVFGCAEDEKPGRVAVTRALDNLAALDVVGTRAQFPAFKRMVADTLGADVFGDCDIEVSSRIVELADWLSCVGGAQNLLENDLKLYEFVEEAVADSLADA